MAISTSIDEVTVAAKDKMAASVWTINLPCVERLELSAWAITCFAPYLHYLKTVRKGRDALWDLYRHHVINSRRTK